jgi:predicted transcriptional regulator
LTQRADIIKGSNQPVEAIMAESDEKSLVAQILSSYLSNNTVAPADLPSVIESVKRAFTGNSETASASIAESEAKSWEPAVPVKKSVSPDAITCLVCGGRFKSLKRHLQSAHEMTPGAYREGFKLKSDYPIVAPAYAAQRSELAKSLGLGRKVGVKAAAKKAGGRRSQKAGAVKAAAE